MAENIKIFLWAMKPDHPFPRKPEEEDSNYIARFTIQMEELAANCIDDINNNRFFGTKTSTISELKVLLSQAADIDSSENVQASICRNAMRIVRYRLISEVLDVLSRKVKKEKTVQTETIPTVSNAGFVKDEKVVSSTEGLANFLGCGKTKAFEIIKSGALKDAGVQYRVGKCWKFNAEKLSKYLAEHPDFLK